MIPKPVAFDPSSGPEVSPSAPTPATSTLSEISPLEPLTAAELLRSVGVTHDGDAALLTATIWLDSPVSRRMRAVFPAPCSRDSEAKVARYVASEANNFAVTRGGSRLHVSCPQDISPGLILETIARNYHQVHQLLASTNPVSASAEPPPWASSAPPPLPRRDVPVLPPRQPAIGINVGQTDTKIVVATRAGAHEELRWRVPTFPPEATTDFNLATRIIQIVETALATSTSDPIEHLGLAMGGIVRGGAINRASGVALELNDTDYESLAALPLLLQERYGLHVAVVQDVEAKAYFHAAHAGKRDCLVLDLGTSLGGAYIDPEGRVSSYLNQVGRIAFDLGETSVPRADGEGDGLLSQYLSARGIVRLAAASGASITDAAQIEHLSISPATPSAEEFLRLLRTRIQGGVSLVAEWYEPSEIVLTGGVVSGQLGQFAQTWLDASSYQVVRSGEPIFDGCLGSAWIALSGHSL